MNKNNILNYLVILILMYLVYYTYKKNIKLLTLISNKDRSNNDIIETEMKQREEELNDRIEDAKKLEYIRRDVELKKMMTLDERNKIIVKKLEIERRKRYYIMLDDLYKRKRYATNLKLTRLKNQRIKEIEARKKQNENKNEELKKKEEDLKKIIDDEIKNEREIENKKEEVIRLNTNFSNWVFSLKNEKHQQFYSRLEDLTKKKDVDQKE